MRQVKLLYLNCYRPFDLFPVGSMFHHHDLLFIKLSADSAREVATGSVINFRGVAVGLVSLRAPEETTTTKLMEIAAQQGTPGLPGLLARLRARLRGSKK